LKQIRGLQPVGKLDKAGLKGQKCAIPHISTLQMQEIRARMRLFAAEISGFFRPIPQEFCDPVHSG
jgi:hypothetical protein